jgi:hypothetical protein
MQNVMLNFVFPRDTLDRLSTAGTEHMPFWALLLFKHFRLFAFLLLIYAVFMLWASVALLKRQNWARVVFVVLLALSIAVGLLLPFLQGSVLASMPKIEEVDAEAFEQALLIFRGIVLALTVLFTAIHGWLIYKLCTPQIRAEFD